MRIKRVILLCALVVLLCITSSCSSLTTQEHMEKVTVNTETNNLVNDTENFLWASITEMPTELDYDNTDTKVINAPDVQQIRYRSIDKTMRLILEIKNENAVISKEIEKELYDMQEGEESISWKQDNMELKLFGNYSKDELKLISQSVKLSK